MSLTAYLLVAAGLFSIGLFGVLTRRHAVGTLLSIELMANAANLNLVAFAKHHGAAYGQLFALFAIALTVAEVVIGLAIVLLLYRANRDVLVDLARGLRN